MGQECRLAFSVIGSFGGSLIVLGFLLVLFSLLFTWRLKTPLVPVMLLPAAIICIAVGLRLRERIPINETATLLKVHVLMTLLVYAFILLAGVVALLYILQDMRLKRRLESRVHLPSLDLMSSLLKTFNVTSWSILIAAIGSGALMASEQGPGWSQNMPWVFYGMTGTWMLLSALLLASWRSWLTGTRLAQAQLAVALVALLGLVGGPH